MRVSNIIPLLFLENKYLENHWSERGGAAADDNQVPPQAPVEAMAMPVNPAGLTNAYVRESLA